jgi:3-methyladenine DNA glycosylase AlkD
MDIYVQSLQAHFSAQADPVTALPMKKYMRNQFDFLGIKTPEMTRLHRQFVTQHGWPDISQLASSVKTLWQLPEREYQYLALRFLAHFTSQLTPDSLPTLEWLILNKSWWDTVDSIAIHPVGDLFSRFPTECEPYLAKWRSHENIWLRRTTLLFQLAYKNETDKALLFSLIKENLDSREFFINKAIGWALREYSKAAPATVEQFVQETDLASLSSREALKWIKKKAKDTED